MEKLNETLWGAVRAQKRPCKSSCLREVKPDECKRGEFDKEDVYLPVKISHQLKSGVKMLVRANFYAWQVSISC